MRNMVFYIVFFAAYVSTTLNAKADFKQNLDSNATTCCVAYNEASQMNFGKKKFFTIAKNDKNIDLNSWSFEQYKTHNADSKKESNQDVLASKNIQSNNDLDPTNTKQNTDIKTEKTTEYPLLHKESKDELFGTISTAEVPDAIPAPLTTKALLSVEDWRDTYFMYIYNFSPMENPNYIPNELKGQISFRVPIVRNIFKSGGIFYFAFTDTFFFQVFNEAASSPVRDNDFQPEFLFTYPMNVTFWGGTLTELTTGWRHISNGEINIEHGGVTDKSRGSDRWIFKGRWTTKHWGVDMEMFFPARFYPENPFIYKYLGSLDVKIFMRYNKHLADATITGLLRVLQPGERLNKRIHGGLRLSYTYKLNPYYGIYMQYFIGYGDYLYEYDRLGHRIGIGVRFIR